MFLNVDEFLDKIVSQIIVPQDKYDIEGDIVSCDFKNGALVGVISDIKSIEFYYPNSAFTKEAVLGQRVHITGFLKIYNSKIQIRVTDMSCVGVSQKELIYKQLRNEFAKYKSSHCDSIRTITEPNKVALIAGENHDGYFDFIKNIKSFNKQKIKEYLVPSLNADNVTKMIQQATVDSVDIICIVRGGKDYFSVLNERNLLQAIVNAKNQGIFIVTGLGHSTVDNILCDDLADYAADAPGLAAIALNKCFSYWYNRNKNTIHSSNSYYKKRSSFNFGKIVIYIIVIVIFAWIWNKFFR